MLEPYKESPKTQNYMRHNQPKMFTAMIAMRVFFVVAAVAVIIIVMVECDHILDKQLDHELKK